MKKLAVLLCLCLLAPCALAESADSADRQVWRGTVLTAEDGAVTMRVEEVMPEDAAFPEEDEGATPGEAAHGEAPSDGTAPDTKATPDGASPVPQDSAEDVYSFRVGEDARVWILDGETYAQAKPADIAAGDTLLVEMVGREITRVVISRISETRGEPAPAGRFSA